MNLKRERERGREREHSHSLLHSPPLATGGIALGRIWKHRILRVPCGCQGHRYLSAHILPPSVHMPKQLELGWSWCANLALSYRLWTSQMSLPLHTMPAFRAHLGMLYSSQVLIPLIQNICHLEGTGLYTWWVFKKFVKNDMNRFKKLCQIIILKLQLPPIFKVFSHGLS